MLSYLQIIANYHQFHTSFIDSGMHPGIPGINGLPHFDFVDLSTIDLGEMVDEIEMVNE